MSQVRSLLESLAESVDKNIEEEMTRIIYEATNVRQSTEDLINASAEVIDDFQSRGFDLTLRQVYYQLVARDIIPNTDKSYSRLGTALSTARMTGLISWDSIVDRTRRPRSPAHWDTPASVIQSAARSYAIDKWQGQDTYAEVWVEKDALIGIVEQACFSLDVTAFSCRGYVSSSAMWRAAMRIADEVLAEDRTQKKTAIIFHLGDHDPSGIDMTRDIQDRLDLFGQGSGLCREDQEEYPSKLWDGKWTTQFSVEVRRIALNMNQIRRYNPPPNPAKVSDSRSKDYIEKYGRSSWELDALDPEVLQDLIVEHILDVMDREMFDELQAKEDQQKRALRDAARRWSQVEEFLGGEDGS